MRSAHAQGYPFSQRGSVTQNVALTEFSISYGRPVARGRALFGALVPWDSVWHPGADSATIVRIDHDVLLDGKAVAAGEYSLWLIPRAERPWTLILSRAAHVFHKPYPGAEFDALRLEVQPAQASAMESMAIYFAAVLRDEAELRLHWGTTYVAVRVRAPYPNAPAAMMRGTYLDDYGNAFEISDTLFVQLPHGRFRLVEWHADEQFVIAHNDSSNASDPGLWTRIDWMPLPGMAPYTWGLCLTAYRAPSRTSAVATAPPNRATPRTGCNGHPFSRMKPAGAATPP